MADAAMSAREDRAATIKVWDPLLRIFHWGLAVCVTAAFLTGDEVKTLHEIAGYGAAGLIAFRLVWGVVGPRRARFAQFVPSPVSFRRYAGQAMRLEAPRYVGHNPLGGAMIVALIGLLCAVSATGWMMTTDAYWGVAWVEEVHEIAANAILVLVLVHVSGVLLSGLAHSENLVRAMIDGRKRPAGPGDID